MPPFLKALSKLKLNQIYKNMVGSGMKIIFIPFAAAGHLLPMLDLAQKFASLGVECTIITTPTNALFMKNSRQISNQLAPHLTIQTLDFPAKTVGLPSGVENLTGVTSMDMASKLINALHLLQKPTEQRIKEIKPDCIISDMFYSWTTDFGVKSGVPRLTFITSTMFHMCRDHDMNAGKFELKDNGMVSFPTFPHKFEMKRSQMSHAIHLGVKNEYTQVLNKTINAALKSDGIITITFNELEQSYVDYYTKCTGVKVWCVGPVSPQGENRAVENNMKWVVDWLDMKKPKSILFVSFGSVTAFPADQLKEIAAGLEASGHDFIWVVRTKAENENEGNDSKDDWSIEEFKERIEGSNKGLVIQNWVPQLLILEHKSIGGMITHCGCNSMIEVINAGVPFITWPLFAEQFDNERLLVDVLKIGVPVGVSTWRNWDENGDEIIERAKIEGAVKLLMGNSKESMEIRERTKVLSEAAKRAVKDGGSSHKNILAIIDEFYVTNRVSV